MAKKTNEEGVSEETATVSVIVTAPLAENGAHYSVGDIMQTSPDRAAALGDLVKPAEAV